MASDATDPADWVLTATLPKGKYLVVETEDDWEVYSHDDHGAFS